MSHTVIAFLLNFVSLIGGHFVNRRWDRAVFILGLLCLWSIGSYIYMWVFYYSEPAMSEVMEFSATIWQAYISGVGVIWLLSLVFTVVDARYRPTQDSAGATGYFGAVVLSLVSSAILGTIVWTVVIALGMHADFEHDATESHGPSIFDDSFYEMIFLDDLRVNWEDLPTPPHGPATLQGQVRYQGQGAEGVKLRLVLNKAYTTEYQLTDAEGRFSIPLAEDQYTIDMVQTRAWKHKPGEGHFKLFSGEEPKLSDGRYSMHRFFKNDSKVIELNKDSHGDVLTLEIRPTVTLTWPPTIIRGLEDNRTVETSVASGVISWQPYAGASQYLVEIDRVERRGEHSRSYHTILQKRVTATSLPLASLEHVTGSDTKKEYNVQIFAFDDDGNLLSVSDTGHGDAAFLLADGAELVSDRVTAELGSGLDATTIESMRKNRKRLDAVAVLIDENMLDGAEQLLATVNGPAPRGEKAMVTGYLAAKQGNCDKARELFDKARHQAGNNCVPKRYITLCE